MRFYKIYFEINQKAERSLLDIDHENHIALKFTIFDSIMLV